MEMVINVHAGHNADGRTACGAIGLIKESTEARRVKDEVIRQLKALGHIVYDCTVDNARNVSANLREIVAKCNAHTVDLDVSIHFNAGAYDKRGNGKSCGTEVLIYNSNSKAKKYAEATCREISKLGFTNRGVKLRKNLYVLHHTNAPAMLIECCFVDDADDVRLYHTAQMASAIVKGITGMSHPGNVSTNRDTEIQPLPEQGSYRVKVTASVLNVRKGAGTDYPIVTTVKKDEVYTIVGESAGWGKLKSGVGYIYLNYTKRI